MAFDAALAGRLREACAAVPGITEKKMFGGLAFLVNGHMACGIVGDTLMVRVGPAAYAAALARPHVREMDFTGRALKGFVYVARDGIESDAALARWVGESLGFVRTLPPK